MGSDPQRGAVLPVDDDDWFAPDVAEVLGGLERGAVAYRWPVRSSSVPSLGHAPYLSGAGFSLAAAAVLLHDEQLRAAEGGRGREARREPRRACEPGRSGSGGRDCGAGAAERDEPTLASQTSLGWLSRDLSQRKLLRRYRAYRPLYAEARPSLPDWSREYVDLVAAL